MIGDVAEGLASGAAVSAGHGEVAHLRDRL
jgi:hypothetical protein